MKSSVKQNYFGKERYPEEQERINECGKRLKEAIKEAGFNQTTFAIAVGVNKSTVSAWCNGTQPPKEENIKKIIEVLNRKLKELGKDTYDISYFRVDTDCKQIKSEGMYKETGLKDKAIGTIKKITGKDSKTNYLFEINTPLNYTNMTNFLLSQEDLYIAFYTNVEKELKEILQNYAQDEERKMYDNVIENIDVKVSEKLNSTMKEILNKYIKELLKNYFPKK